jgi:hypothetical protein
MNENLKYHSAQVSCRCPGYEHNEYSMKKAELDIATRVFDMDV